MPDPRDPLDDRWLRQRLAATLDDAGRIPRRRLPFPSAAADRDRQARRSGFLAGALTTALVLGIAWAGVTLGTQRASRGTTPPQAPASTPSPSAGRIVSSTDLPDPAYGLVVADGSVWVPDDPAGTLLRIDATTGHVAATVRVGAKGGHTAGVVATPGAIWLANQTPDELVGVDPGSDQVIVRVPLGATPSSIATDGSSVWLAGNQGNVVIRVAVGGAASRVTARIAVAHPTDVAAGGGRVWVVSQLDGILWRVDPSSNAITRALAPPPALDYVVGAVAASQDGAWFRNIDEQSVEHFDAASSRIVDRAPLGGPQSLGIQDPFTVATTPTAVWATVTGALVRVDVRTTTVSTVPMVQPTGVAVAPDGSVWVTTAQGRLIHVAPLAR